MACALRCFEARADSDGVGRDSFLFAVDGVNQQQLSGKSHDFGSKWENGQVIGFAIDTSKEGGASMSVSVDDSFAAPNGLALTAFLQAGCPQRSQHCQHPQGCFG